LEGRKERPIQTSGTIAPKWRAGTVSLYFYIIWKYGSKNTSRDMSSARVRAYPVAGSAYTYTQQAFGPSTGFLTGWALLLDYIFLPLLSYLLIGIYMSEYFPGVPTAVWVLGAIALVTTLNLVGIESITRVNWILIVAQLVFIVVFVALSVHTLSEQSAPVSTNPGARTAACPSGSAIRTGTTGAGGSYASSYAIHALTRPAVGASGLARVHPSPSHAA
jgi:amino acid transporter